MFAVVKELNFDEVCCHVNDFQWKRDAYIVPGPNFVWSIDGHCKLEFFDIEVYVDIDAYSQYITWIYVEIFNHTAISVLV